MERPLTDTLALEAGKQYEQVPYRDRGVDGSPDGTCIIEISRWHGVDGVLCATAAARLERTIMGLSF